MRNVGFFSIATAAVVALNLSAMTVSSVDAVQHGGGGSCVAVSGGTVQNATVLDVAADGGTGISDASGGSGNLAAVTSNNHDGNNDNHNNNHRNNNNNNNRNNWSAEPLQSLELRLQQTDTASSGNGGVATSSANGGAVSVQDINSGGNAGNAISVGNTTCPGAAVAPSKGGGGGNAGGNVTVNAGGGRGGKVRALPNTGIGMNEAGTSGSLLLALGALGMLGLSVGSRLDRRVSATAGR
jgi:hypothetical protein